MFDNRRGKVEGELAWFSFRLWSRNVQIDNSLTQDVLEHDSQTPLELEIRERASAFFPGYKVEIADFRLERGGSISMAFGILLAISTYQLVSRYDSFRNSLDRLRDDIRNVLLRVSRVRRFPEEYIIEAEWSGGPLLARAEAERFTRASPDYSYILVRYLMFVNIVLVILLVALVLKAAFS